MLESYTVLWDFSTESAHAARDCDVARGKFRDAAVHKRKRRPVRAAVRRRGGNTPSVFAQYLIVAPMKKVRPMESYVPGNVLSLPAPVGNALVVRVGGNLSKTLFTPACRSTPVRTFQSAPRSRYQKSLIVASATSAQVTPGSEQ